MEEAIRVKAAGPTTAGPDIKSRPKLEYALELLLTHRGNPSAEVERVLTEDPENVFGHCLRAAIIVCTDAVAARPSLAASVAAIEAACTDAQNPARRHAAAARAWFDRDPALAAERYGAILIDWPRDALALVVAHALDFRLGHRRMLRDRVARVLPELGATPPHYASVLAMYAFGLEENGQYRRAEKVARRALAVDARHAGAIHVIAHVLEMQGRAREGLAFLAATESAWLEGTGFSAHLAWHRALFHVDAGNPEAALATYDSQIMNAEAPGLSVLADASSLLWRLDLRNIDVGERWRVLADGWERQSLAGARPFYVVHAMMAFAAAGRTAAAVRVIKSFREIETSSGSFRLPEEALAPPFCEALLAFTRSDFSACVDWLTRVRHIAHRCGGSLAQCDLIHLTFTEAALRARKDRLARALVTERATRKPASQLNRLLQQRLHAIGPAFVGQSPPQPGSLAAPDHANLKDKSSAPHTRLAAA
jgi:tetratricopeptide (TPR) repeat protein